MWTRSRALSFSPRAAPMPAGAGRRPSAAHVVGESPRSPTWDGEPTRARRARAAEASTATSSSASGAGAARWRGRYAGVGAGAGAAAYAGAARATGGRATRRRRRGAGAGAGARLGRGLDARRARGLGGAHARLGAPGRTTRLPGARARPRARVEGAGRVIARRARGPPGCVRRPRRGRGRRDGQRRRGRKDGAACRPDMPRSRRHFDRAAAPGGAALPAQPVELHWSAPSAMSRRA